MARLLVPIFGVAVALAFVLLFLPTLWKKKNLFEVSPLVGKPPRKFVAETLDGKTFTFPPKTTKPILLNFFASWCLECGEERYILSSLKERYDLVVIGVVFRDSKENIKRYLQKHNPYDVVVWDEGVIAIDWGVTGVPETFVIAGGKVIYKFIGPISVPRLVRMLKQGEAQNQRK